MPMKTYSYNKDYFLNNPYQKTVFFGWKRYFDQYYWARKFYSKVIKRYKKNGRLLEIGCGFGDLLKLLEKDFATFGIDISNYAISLAQKK